MPDSIFDYSGLASLDDLCTAEWQSLFTRLEAVQETFGAAQPHVAEYPWPRDPLHSCTRVWEYPFVYHHLKRILEKQATGSLPIIVDLGSGATFFPFAVAQAGGKVIAVDADRNAQLSLDRAVKKVTTGNGQVSFSLSDARDIQLQGGSVDCVYCVSVLEHIPDFVRVVSEASRILRPDGLFILTFDVDLKGNFELGPPAYLRLLEALGDSFSYLFPQRVVHPLRMLTSDNSPYPMYPRKALGPVIRGLLGSFKLTLTGRRTVPERLLVSTYGACLVKR